MKKIIIFINSCLFSIISFTTTVPMSFLYMLIWLIPFVKVKDKKHIIDRLSTKWGILMLWFLKVLTGIKWNIEGYDKIDKTKPYIVVGKHESTWETLIMHSFMNPAPIFILKKQLLFVPFIGWCLASSNHISIDRKSGAKAVIKMLKQAKDYVNKGHNIIIFPQGTRVPPDASIEDYPYKTGFVGLIQHCKVDILPMALNSGLYWSKKKFMKKSGNITMKFLDLIPYSEIANLSKKEIIEKIQNIIEPESKKLAKIDL